MFFSRPVPKPPLPFRAWSEFPCATVRLRLNLTMTFRRFGSLLLYHILQKLCYRPAYAPVGTTDQKLVEIAGTRWTVETCFREAKDEVGLDQYEVRTYDAWHKHITFALLAIALITVLSAKSLDRKSFQQHDPANSSLDEFNV